MEEPEALRLGGSLPVVLTGVGILAESAHGVKCESKRAATIDKGMPWQRS